MTPTLTPLGPPGQEQDGAEGGSQTPPRHPTWEWGQLTTGSAAGGPVLISMRVSGSSSSGASSGITTTGLMCSASAEARRKLGGPYRGSGWELLSVPSPTGSPPSTIPRAHVGSLLGARNPQSARAQGRNKGCSSAGGRHLGQPGDLDEPLEVEHVRGSAEEVSEAAGDGQGEVTEEPGSGWAAPAHVAGSHGVSSRPGLSAAQAGTCETARGTGPCGLAGCLPGDLRAVQV